MIPAPTGAADAVILVDDSGTVTLFIGDELEPRAEETTNAEVIRILVDHAADAGRPLAVATHYPSGHRTLHRVQPDGTVTASKAVPARVTAGPGAGSVVPATALTGNDPGAAVPAVLPRAARPGMRASAVLGTAALLALALPLMSSSGPPGSDDSGLNRLAMGTDPNTTGLDIDRPLGVSSPTSPGTPPQSSSTSDPTGSPGPSQPTEQTPGQDPGTSDETSPDRPSPSQPPDQPTPPTQPSGLGIAGRTGSSLTASWDATTADLDVTGYAVYVDGSHADTVISTRATVGGLSTASSYLISVAAIDASGTEGSKASITATTLDTESPSSPSDLTVIGRTGTSLTASWDGASDNVGVAGYDVYVHDELVASVSGTTATVDDLTPATSYHVSVAAKDEAGNVGRQVSLRAMTKDTIAPSRPGDLGGYSGISTITLDWASSTDNVDVSGYAVYLDGRKVKATTSTTVTIDGLDSATDYTCAVVAYDAAGNHSKRATVVIRTIAPP